MPVARAVPAPGSPARKAPARPPERPLPARTLGVSRSGHAGSPRELPAPCQGALLELEVHPRRYTNLVTAAPGGRARAAVVDELRVRGIVAVRLDAVTAGADVVVRVAVVRRVGRLQIPAQLPVQLVPPADGVHVGLVVADAVRVEVVLSTRVAD